MKKLYFLITAFWLFTSVNAQVINFPDINFKNALLQSNPSKYMVVNINGNNISIDANGDGEIQVSEALDVKWLNFSYSGITNINDVTGIEYFKNLEQFIISNNNLAFLDVSQNNKLTNLKCFDNKIKSLNVKGLSKLEVLNCGVNLLTDLDLSTNVSLVQLECDNNQLVSLDLSNCPNFTWGLFCPNNNKLKYINLKNGNSNLPIYFTINNSNLNYICVDSQVEANAIIAKSNLVNCNINTYCDFVPGGQFFTVEGVNRLDNDNNGCHISDAVFPNIKFKVVNGTNIGSFISNNSGIYSIPVAQGTHTITPVLGNPTYFTISPTTISVNFPTQASPLTQDFCITPNGSHSDIEVSMIPVQAARPGFDAKYKIVYKNKGNQVESGSVNLTFDDSKMDFVSASATPIQSTGLLTWDYTNLQPFETRTIDVVFNINSPMETPAVNGGDVLSYTTTVSSGNSDEMPNDNTFTLNQTVVNSFDPNDITCLEGASVSASKVGDYVHYMIRFENTGSANATNIVVKDVVDAAKYDVNSIVPINGSHDFYTRIYGNNVEFIFENINLPFADAINDGYVSFKIKIKSTLVTGDAFSKNANIYFDYNFPIVTNTATTTIAALSNQDFEFKNYFKIYPNPVVNTLTIETKDVIEISSINIYNTLGQLVLVVPNSQNIKTVDVSSLTSGNYFIKINSDKGTSNTKFIKN